MDSTLSSRELQPEEAAPECICAPQNTRLFLTMMGAAVVEPDAWGTVTLCGEKFTLPVTIYANSDLLSTVTPKPFPRDYECRIGDRIYPFFSINEGTAKIADPPIDLKAELIAETDGQKILGPLFLKFLEEVATNVLGGMNIILHTRLPSGMHAPINSKENTIHMFMGCVPTLAGRYINPKTTFDIHVCTNEGYEACLLPSPLGGITLSDGTHDIVQIVGNNIYVLFDPFRLHSLGIHAASAVFYKTVALAMSGWMKRDELKKDGAVPAMTREDLVAFATLYVERREKATAELVRNKQERIHRLEEAIREEKRDLAHIVRFYRTLKESNFDRHGIDRMIADHERMLLCPLVESASIVPDSGIEVRTKMITIVHGDRNYLIGRFVVRFGFDDPLLIWAEESFHPNGEPHPHISAHNGPCFGNTATAIDDAVLEYRYADALEYIMLWLGSYTEELVIWHKIEEWPSEEIAEKPEVSNE